MESAKRIKKPHFSDEETAAMLEEIATEAVCLLSSFQNTVTIKTKQAIWIRITDKVNAIGGNGRTQDQIKKKWKDLKSAVLRKKQEAKKTGGGPPTPPIPFEDLVMSILGSNTNLTSGISEADLTDTLDYQQTISPSSSHNLPDSHWSSHTPGFESQSAFVPVMGPPTDLTFPAGATFQTLDLAFPSSPRMDRPTTSTASSNIQIPHRSRLSTVTPSSTISNPEGPQEMPIQERPASTPPRLQSTHHTSRSKKISKRTLFHPGQAETEDETSEKLWRDFLRSQIRKNELKNQLLEHQLWQLKD